MEAQGRESEDWFSVNGLLVLFPSLYFLFSMSLSHGVVIEPISSYNHTLIIGMEKILKLHLCLGFLSSSFFTVSCLPLIPGESDSHCAHMCMEPHKFCQSESPNIS
jgi:hypothetical protein